MGIAEEEEALGKFVKDFRSLSSAELSDMIRKMPERKRALFDKPYRGMMRFATQAEELLAQGRVNQAMELLNQALSLGYLGKEYPYGLFGDVYMKRGDRQRALEMYQKSGSTDSLKKIKTLGLDD